MRLLLVEDEPKIAHFIKRGLEEEHYAVDVAEDGKDALALADVTPYDLVVLDLMLPDIDGLDVCRRLRQRGRDVPVLMLTARGTLDDKVAGLDIGADDYLVKPFAFAELLARTRALLRRQEATKTAQLRPRLSRRCWLLSWHELAWRSSVSMSAGGSCLPRSRMSSPGALCGPLQPRSSGSDSLLPMPPTSCARR
jgi:DNA-binding response OmpR family regulator